MKKFVSAILAITLMFAFSACGSNADDTTTTTAELTTAELTTEETTAEDETTEVETTEEDVDEVATEVETTRRSEYDLYKTSNLEEEELPISFNGDINKASFYYVPYENRTETDFYFTSVLRVEVAAPSEELEIYFQGNENVFPGNIPEAVVKDGENTKAEYNLDKGENSATMKGFEPGMEKIEIYFPMYMSVIDMPIDGEPYEVTCLQVVFVGK